MTSNSLIHPSIPCFYHFLGCISCELLICLQSCDVMLKVSCFLWKLLLLSSTSFSDNLFYFCNIFNISFLSSCLVWDVESVFSYIFCLPFFMTWTTCFPSSNVNKLLHIQAKEHVFKSSMFVTLKPFLPHFFLPAHFLTGCWKLSILESKSPRAKTL